MHGYAEERGRICCRVKYDLYSCWRFPIPIPSQLSQSCDGGPISCAVHLNIFARPAIYAFHFCGLASSSFPSIVSTLQARVCIYTYMHEQIETYMDDMHTTFLLDARFPHNGGTFHWISSIPLNVKVLFVFPFSISSLTYFFSIRM